MVLVVLLADKIPSRCTALATEQARRWLEWQMGDGDLRSQSMMETKI